MLLGLSARGALFGLRQFLLVSSEQGIFILIVSALVLLIGYGTTSRGNDTSMLRLYGRFACNGPEIT
ncbi:MAG: hypothetical protein AMXMBFR7_51980 [Planctomycetota bacterium]